MRNFKVLQFLAGVACLSLAGPLCADGLPKPFSSDDFIETSMEEVRLGQLLFYDPVISGNKNISCATCHHPAHATGDGLSLGIGEGGIGLGPDRIETASNPPEQRIPRNAPALFNLGVKDLRVLFHDGRIEVDDSKPSGLRTPMGEDMLAGFANLLSAQTMFPVLSADEMAGHYQENDVSQAVRQGLIVGPGGAWDLISRRVSSLPVYAELFQEAYPQIATSEDIDFTDISNAIAAFMAFEWRADDSRFDQALRGEISLTSQEQAGQDLFYGSAECSSCHSGILMSDQGFHARGQPQLGPGKAARFESHQRDVGRMRVTGNASDAYAFRTPMLRNVMQTGPWGHAGAFSDIAAFLRHHSAPRAGLLGYEEQATLPKLAAAKPDWAIMSDPAERVAISQAIGGPERMLEDNEIEALIAFLGALDDPTSLSGRLGVPQAVPSGLPLDQ